MLVRTFLAKKQTKIVIMPQQLNSLDFVASEFFLFPKRTAQMKEKRFATIEELKEKSKQMLLRR